MVSSLLHSNLGLLVEAYDLLRVKYTPTINGAPPLLKGFLVS